MRIPVRPWRKLLLSIRANLKRHDPDLILTHWGDTWLFPRLLQVCEDEGIGYFNPNRDQERSVLAARMKTAISPTGRSSTAAAKPISTAVGISTSATP